MGLPAVRPAGLVLQPEFDTALLVTRYLDGSWQYRRLFMRLPPEESKHRSRLLEKMMWKASPILMKIPMEVLISLVK